VFFDFGGTLFSYRNVGGGQGTLIRDAIQRLRIEVQPGRIATAYRDANRDAYLEVGRQPYYLHQDLFRAMWRHFARRLGAPVDDQWVDWLIDSQRQLVTTQIELRDNCVTTLRALRDAGRRVSVVSNIDDDYLEPMIQSTGLADVLHEWTSSERARSCKPHAEIYRHACERAGVAPENVLFVGDSPEQDIAGARAFGMTTALIRDTAPPPGTGVGEAGEPHHEIQKLAEVLPLAL
jgi:putative hydrolase of the HAD superfamily